MDAGNPIGRVDVVLINEGEALVSWMEDASIKLMRIDKDGIQSNIKTVTTTSESRSSGFPQMTFINDQVIFAWTDDVTKVVKSAVVNVSAL